MLWQICKRQAQAGLHNVAFSPDGKSVAFSVGNLVKIWNVETGADPGSLMVSSFMRVRGRWWGGRVSFQLRDRTNVALEVV